MLFFVRRIGNLILFAANIVDENVVTGEKAAVSK